jgi:integrase/recombinase XerC
MDNPIVPFARPILTPALPSVGSIDMYGCLLADAKNPRTLQARIDDIRDLGKFLGVSDPAACVALVIGATRGQGAAVAIGWQKHMLDKGLSGATINRRLSTLRRLCKLAGRLEVIDWAIDADNVKAQTYKDTKGPGHVGWKSILDVATKDAAAGSAKGGYRPDSCENIL